jgi:hypothetical protein
MWFVLSQQSRGLSLHQSLISALSKVKIMHYLETILDELDRSREQLLLALEELDDEGLLVPDVVDAYTIADCLALQTAWEAELVTAFLRLERGQKPDKLLQALAEPEVVESRWVAENRARDLDAIFDDYQGVRVQLEEWLESFSEKDLNNPKRYPWLKGRTLAQLIAQLTYEREAGYTPAIAAFTQQWLAEMETLIEPSADLFISLTERGAENGDSD